MKNIILTILTSALVYGSALTTANAATSAAPALVPPASVALSVALMTDTDAIGGGNYALQKTGFRGHRGFGRGLRHGYRGQRKFYRHRDFRNYRGGHFDRGYSRRHNFNRHHGIHRHHLYFRFGH